MKVDTMRRIDYWVGVPLCFLTSLIFKLQKVLKWIKEKSWLAPEEISNHTVERPKALIIALSEMGSIVLAEPALIELREKNDLYFLTFRRSKPVLELLGIIPERHIFTIDVINPMGFIRDTLKALLWSRKQRFEWVLDLELFSRYSTLMSAYSGAARRVGFHAFYTEGLYRGDLLTHRVSYNPHIHISKNYLSLAYATLFDAKQPPNNNQLPLNKTPIADQALQLTPRKVAEADIQAVKLLITKYFQKYDDKNHHLVIINSQGGDLLPMRNWGQDSFLQLSRLILKRFNQVIIVLSGSAEEFDAIEHLNQALNHPRSINFAGAIALKQILALYQISELMVSNDSGPNHFAALVDMPTYTLFGPETPALYGSLGTTTNIYKGLACSPCVSAANHRKTICCNNQCMQQITVEEVYQQVEQHLQGLGIA